ncbi:MAG: FAD-dependent thymidylate synthase [Clostridiales bacterium]|nr:FAD-dependent thymidylate synthase [Clostridiales bacterium]
MPEKSLKVALLTYTPDPEKTCALAARMCYSHADVDALREKVSQQDQAAYLQRILSSGHLSVLEHASFTFAVEGVSRVLLAQLTRHRIASFSVQSQRYVSLKDDFFYIIPPRIRALGEEAAAEYRAQMETAHGWYEKWQALLGDAGESSNEDARFVLPSACETRLTLTMNARELRHFFSLRCCNRAQWEIRELATQMLFLCRQAAPALFNDAGPSCLNGACPEGGKTCGQAAAVREKFKA